MVQLHINKRNPLRCNRRQWMNGLASAAQMGSLGGWLLALGLDPLKQNMSNVSRPIPLVDPTAGSIHEVLS